MYKTWTEMFGNCKHSIVVWPEDVERALPTNDFFICITKHHTDEYLAEYHDGKPQSGGFQYHLENPGGIAGRRKTKIEIRELRTTMYQRHNVCISPSVIKSRRLI